MILLFVSMFTLLACNDKYPDLEDGLYAEMITNKGTMVLKLYNEDAPATVANFVALAEGTHPLADTAYAGKPYYNGLTFHRIMKDFMIQGGDPTGTGSGGPGYQFPDELTPDRRHDKKGILSMANSGYGTNGSQFFITHKETPHLDGYDASGNLKNCENPRVSCHTVWGEVVVGMDVLDSIATTEMKEPRSSEPMEKVIIEQVNIVRKGDAFEDYDAAKTFTTALADYEEKKAAEEAERAKKYESYKMAFDEKREKAEELASGLKIYFDQKGEGVKPNLGQTVKVDYAGYFASTGELFDTSMEAAAEEQEKIDERRKAAGAYKPMEAKYSPDASLIAGFKEGLQQMSVGDKATLFIPYHLAYGDQGYPGAIPPKADLIFVLKLLEVVK